MLQIRVESVLSMYCILENLSSDPVGTGGCTYDPVGTGGCAYDPVGTGGCARSYCIGLSGLILYKNGRKDYEMDDRIGHSRFGILL